MGTVELLQRNGDASAAAQSGKPTRREKSESDYWCDEEIAAGESSDGDLFYSDGSDHSEGISLLKTSLDEVDGNGNGINLLDPENGDGDEPRPCLSLSRMAITGRLWHQHWLGPEDTGWTAGGAVLLDPPAVKLAKFVAVTALCLLLVHAYAARVGDKRDETLGLHQLLVYDGADVATDALAFFVVGRLYEADAPGVDTLEFAVPLLLVALGQSWGATHLSGLQHSITPKEVLCDWTWPMYALVIGGCLPLLGGLVVAHALEAVGRGRGLRKLIEVGLCLGVVLAPYCVSASSRHGDPYDGDDNNDNNNNNNALRSFVHWHHWYWAWVLGMHCNFHTRWWSRLAMSVLWGIYVNGVAIFGRDPVLGCAVSLYRSQSQECFPYLSEDYGYGNYTLWDLGTDLGILSQLADVAGSGEIPDVCASDVTRWLLG